MDKGWGLTLENKPFFGFNHMMKHAEEKLVSDHDKTEVDFFSHHKRKINHAVFIKKEDSNTTTTTPSKFVVNVSKSHPLNLFYFTTLTLKYVPNLILWLYYI